MNTAAKSSRRFSSLQTQPSRAALALAAAFAALPAVQAQPFTVTGVVLTASEAGLAPATPPGSGKVWDLADGQLAVAFPLSSGDGSLTVAEGGALFVGGLGVGSKMAGEIPMVGGWVESGGNGEVTVTGPNSAILNSGDLVVALSSVGTFTISNGAGMLNTHAVIGSDANYLPAQGFMTVTGAGSSWISTGDLTVGSSFTNATGSVRVEAGGSTWVGGTTTLTERSTLTLDGGRLRLNGYSRHEASTLSYQSGLVQLAGDRTIGTDAVVRDFFGDSPVIAAGKHLAVEGKATVQGPLVVEQGGSFVVGAPTAEFAPSATGVVVNSTLTLDYGDITAAEGLEIASTGTVDGMGGVTGDVVNAGQITPSNVTDPNSIGWFDVYGDFTQTATGSISLRLLGAFDHDLFYVEGQMSLGGTLNILSPDGYMPAVGDVFHLFAFGGVDGAFDQINSFTLGEGLAWDFSQLYVDGTIAMKAFVAPPATSVFINGAVSPAPAEAPGSEWNVGTALTVGTSGTGSLGIITGGSVTNDAGFIGLNRGDVGTVTVTGEDAVWTNNGDLAVGESGTGTLAIAEGGAVYNNDAYAGFNAGSTGTVTVSGENSLWANSGMLVVGYEGNASLSITDGGAVTSVRGVIAGGVDSRASATVSGAGSSWAMVADLQVGASGEGALTIADGASVSNEVGTIGVSAGARGAVDIAGIGSTWTNRSALLVGDEGDGTLSITEGAHVTSAVGFVGFNSGSRGEATVSGAGSSWASTGDLYVGRAGEGFLAVADGGSVSNQNSYVGSFAGVRGEASLRGAGSSWTSRGDLVVGDRGVGSLDISEGAQVSATNTYLGRNDGSEATVTVAGAGSGLNTTGDLVVGGRSLAESGASTASLTVRDGGAVNVGGSMAVHEGGSVAVSAHQSVTVAGNLVNNGVITVTAPHDLAAGSYTPISVGGSMSGAGSYRAIGGVWNSTTHQFVVAEPVTVASGGVATVDLAENQRVDVSGGGDAPDVSLGFSSDTTGPDGSSTFRVSVNTGVPALEFDGKTADLTFSLSTDAVEGELSLYVKQAVSSGILGSDATGVLYNPAIGSFSFVPATFSSGGFGTIATITRPGNRYGMVDGSTMSLSGDSFGILGGDDFGTLSEPFDPTTTWVFGIFYDTAAIPEPSSFGALIGLGALGSAALRRRRR